MRPSPDELQLPVVTSWSIPNKALQLEKSNGHSSLHHLSLKNHCNSELSKEERKRGAKLEVSLSLWPPLRNQKTGVSPPHRGRNRCHRNKNPLFYCLKLKGCKNSWAFFFLVYFDLRGLGNLSLSGKWLIKELAQSQWHLEMSIMLFICAVHPTVLGK